MKGAPKCRHFATPAAFRAWLQKNHETATELWVGFYKKDSGKGGITYHEALDQALCFGWIDGIRKRVDESSYTNRFTPRRPGSKWSPINVKRAGQLSALELMAEPGIAAFAARASYAFADAVSGEARAFNRDQMRTFRANEKAWTFFRAQPPGYQRMARRFVSDAKKDETQLRRLATLIRISASGRRLDPLGPASK